MDGKSLEPVETEHTPFIREHNLNELIIAIFDKDWKEQGPIFDRIISCRGHGEEKGRQGNTKVRRSCIYGFWYRCRHSRAHSQARQVLCYAL